MSVEVKRVTVLGKSTEQGVRTGRYDRGELADVAADFGWGGIGFVEDGLGFPVPDWASVNQEKMCTCRGIEVKVNSDLIQSLFELMNVPVGSWDGKVVYDASNAVGRLLAEGFEDRLELSSELDPEKTRLMEAQAARWNLRHVFGVPEGVDLDQVIRDIGVSPCCTECQTDVREDIEQELRTKGYI